MKRTVGTVLAGITELLFGAGLLLMGIGMIALNSQMRNVPQQPPMPKGFLVVMGAMYGAMGAVAIATAIGVFKGMNWARIVSLVAGVLLALVCALCGLLMLVMPFPATPGQAVPVSTIRVIMVAVFAIPTLIGIWWTILFTRPKIVEMFRASAGPESPSPRPISITVIASFFIFSGVFSPLFQLYQRAPAVLFGAVIPGGTGLAINLLWGLIFLVLGIGLMRLDLRAWKATLVLLAFGLLNGVVTWSLPGRAERFESIVRSSRNYDPNLTRQMAWVTSPWYLFAVAFLAALLPAYFIYTRRAAFEAHESPTILPG